MDAGDYAVVVAFLAGTVRALMLWRAAIGVDVVNVAVLGAVAEGRGADLGATLRRSGSAPYLDVAAAIAQALLELRASGSDGTDLRKRLQRAADTAVVAGMRQLGRHAWLDYVTLAAIAFAGLQAAVAARASHFDVAGVAAATLLWLSNVRGARSIATRMVAGASALVESLLSVARLPDA